MSSLLVPPIYPVKIRDLEFCCLYSRLYRDRSNLDRNVVDTAQENPADYLRQAFSRCNENIRTVLDFLRTYLNYIGLDGQGKTLIVNINCTDHCIHIDKDRRECGISHCYEPKPRCELANSYFVPYEEIEQFIFGQVLIDNNLEYLSDCLTIVAHEIFHAVTHFSCDLSYGDNISAALHESYSDIFAVLVNNRDKPDIGNWNWAVGDTHFNITRFLDNEQDMSTYDNSKDCYHNMGIHNYAVFKLITTKDESGKYLFNNRTGKLPILFYTALQKFGKSKGKVSRNFSDSRAAIKSAAPNCFGSDENYSAISEAIEHAFDIVQIPAPPHRIG